MHFAHGVRNTPQFVHRTMTWGINIPQPHAPIHSAMEQSYCATNVLNSTKVVRIVALLFDALWNTSISATMFRMMMHRLRIWMMIVHSLSLIHI